MKQHVLIISLALIGSFFTAKAQQVNSISQLQPEQKAAAKSIVLTGTPTLSGNSDFRQLRDLCFRLNHLDLSRANCPVIPKNALYSHHRLQTILLPQGVEEIGSQAFFACDSLQTLRLPASLRTVGTASFSGCKRLSELRIEGTPELGAYAFAHCSGLRRIVVNSPVPPTAQATTFSGIDPKHCQLVLPKGARKAYRTAEGWRHFFQKESTALVPDSLYLTPALQSLRYTGNEPLLWKNVGRIVVEDGLENEHTHLKRILSERTTFKSGRGKGTVRLSLNPSLENEEAYILNVSASGITLQGSTPQAVFWGLMTLEQMLIVGDGEICAGLPAVEIADAPRTRMRELMVDPARIFIPLQTLKDFVVEMARYKFNALHLHLVDDQAWRIEIKSYPLLTELGASRVGMDDMLLPTSGFYTQAEMRELVDFAARYHVEIIPEIEMPGHEVAAIHCYPQLTCGGRQVPIRLTCGVSNELLCPGEEFVYEFLGNVFRELADVFPSRYIHLGGDEAGNPALDCWTHCKKCQALKQRLGIITTDRSENWRLQEYMFQRAIDTLRTCHGKTPMFWYETDFKNIPEGCITFAWRHGLTNAAIDAAMANGAHIMLCPGEHCYLDYPMARGDMPEVNWGMPTTSLKQTYSLEPSWGRENKFEEGHLYGVAGTLWSECITSPERLFYQAYPRAIALAEVGWSQPSKRSWASFCKRLQPLLADMMHRGLPFSMQYEGGEKGRKH